MAKWDHEDLKDKSRDMLMDYQKDSPFVGSTTSVPKTLPVNSPQPDFSISDLNTQPMPLELAIGKVPKPIDYKYSEGRIMDELKKYVDSTYGQHYVSKNNVQALDMWEALGNLFTSSRDTAIKYLCRAGKKGTMEDTRKDILKTIHYCIFMLHSLDTEEE